MKGFLLLCLIVIGVVTACDQSVVFLLDVSGSMHGTEEKMVFGVNNLLEKMKQKYNDKKCNLDVAIHMFNAALYYSKSVSLIDHPYITVEECKGFGNNRLYDSLATVIDKSPNNTIIVIATGGKDNASTWHTPDSIRSKIETAEEKHGMEFIFVANGPDSFHGGYSAGLQKTAFQAADLGASFAAINTDGQLKVGAVGISTMAKVSAKINKKQ